MSPRRDAEPTGLSLYDRTAVTAAASVIRAYSTSFSLATRLLGPRPRPHVRNVYALVRIADEIVDGPAREAGLDETQQRHALDMLEQETADAVRTGFSTNLVVHAFAATARECGIGADLTAPFFASMRTDISTLSHDDASHDAYVYGSAEVVGLMCLAVFHNAGAAHPVPPPAHVVTGARALGRAFQDVNFLRDLDHDASALGRDYLAVDDQERTRTDVLDRIDADLAAAAAVIPELPADCRRAVTAAHDLFAALSERLRRATPGAPRVRVPSSQKAQLAAHAWLGGAPRGARS
ncbi:squalene/phytoene synthase family protein [Microbacterium sp. cx-55]|uniref:phytoene/squalene synthase family protein n=1 Tax=Microbacterium sp. cx-55 TaxID=2875948 RepID=UPI001CBC285B|nr:squalene/phytoene synthase family protein [Microbacterium sp. cx-55]MBZ4485931.1 squalene/phytoene synthase family protein [Microbacterium sp. cx-55]UGB34194.1 squalene/phytoene synthase family protein [Microbacterium sp. cx-55]